MQVQKKDLAKSQIELTIELSAEEFKPYIKSGAEKISSGLKIKGFRPGKIPYDILKQKISEMTILEEAARIAINKTLESAIRNNVAGQPVGQPQVNIVKLAPDNPMEYKAVLALLPDTQLGDYKNAKVKQEKAEVKDEEADKMIEQLMEMRVKETIADREVENGDKVIVDTEIFLDKVPVEGGQGKDTGVIVGKGYIVPGFGKKLIGAKKGDVREFSLPYPKDHHQQNLAGKLAEFKVTVKEIYQRELPEVNREFVKNFGFNSVGQFKENIKKSLIFEKQQKAEQKAELEMLDKIIAKTKFSDIPEILVNNEAQTMMAELEASVAKHGGKFDDYLSHLKKTKEQLTLDMLPEAVKRVKTSLLIREIAQAEKIKVDDREVEKELERLLKQYKNEKDDIKEKIKSLAYKEYTKNLLNGRKVIEKLKEWNVSK
ncbi:MAG: trigger factor [Patescibacteria group bacterium]|nr:trigger factor [Patescibacteria group bacterium]